VVNAEIDGIKAAFESFGKEYVPELAFVTINKKINQRFFSFRQEGRGGRGGFGKRSELVNPESGTVVSDVITSPLFDFFLASQNVNQGCCTPTRYWVHYNTTDLEE